MRILFVIAVLLLDLATAEANDVDSVIFRNDVTVLMSGPWVDKSRPEVSMKLAGYPTLTNQFQLPDHRTLMIQIYQPQEKSPQAKLPIILFSGGWGEDFRLYSTLLKNISARGYLVLNIDHYSYQNTQPHPQGYDDWISSRRRAVESLKDQQKQEQFTKTKLAALEIYSQDILFVMNHLSLILTGEQRANTEKVILMGHSLGGNAAKKVIERMLGSSKTTKKVKGLISFDSRLNQLGLKTSFEVPTLVLGASSWYVNDGTSKDPLRQLPPQPHLKLKILEHTTHVSFDDFSIFAVLGKDLRQLKVGMNDFAQQELENDIRTIENGNMTRFGERLFLGGKTEMVQFVNDVASEVDLFLKSK